MENFIMKEAAKSDPVAYINKMFDDLMLSQHINGCGSVILTVKDVSKPDRIIRSGDGKVTVVLWEDGEKTIVRRSADTEDDPYAAFCIALAKKVYGSNSAVKRIIEKKTVAHK